MKTLLTILGLAITLVSATAQPQVGMDKVFPTAEQLGEGWISNNMVVLVDPLSSPSVVTNAEVRNVLDFALWKVSKDGLEAYGHVNYFCEPANPTCVLVRISRFKSKGDIPREWGWGADKRARSYQEMHGKPPQIAVEPLPGVGEEMHRYYKRMGGTFNNLVFHRDSYLIDIEARTAPLAKLKQMAKVLDDNLLKALGQSATKAAQPATTK